MDHSLSPDALDLVMARAFSLMAAGDAERARLLCRGAAALSTTIEPRRGEAVASLMLGDGPGATEAIEDALRLASAANVDTEALEELQAIHAKARLAANDPKGARAIATDLLQNLSPTNRSSWVEPLRSGLRSLPREQDAPAVDQSILDATRALLMAAARGERPLADAFGLDDRALLAWYDAGVRHLEQQSAEEAQRIFRGLITLDATAPLFHFAYAQSCELLGEMITARSAHDRAAVVAMRTAPDLFASALLRRARFFFGQGDIAAARSDLARALALDAPQWEAEERATAEEMHDAAERFLP